MIQICMRKVYNSQVYNFNKINKIIVDTKYFSQQWKHNFNYFVLQ